MLCRTQVRATLVVAVTALAMLGACSDSSEDLAGPPIPTLAGEASDGGIETLAGGSLDAGCPCAEWACAISVCGYDTATDSRGACCTQCTTGSIPPEPKPSCDPGGGGGGGPTCSSQRGARIYGGTGLTNTSGFCRTDIEQDPSNQHYDTRCVSPAVSGDPDGGDFYFGSVCPIEIVCCYGGNYGDSYVY